MSGQEEIVEVQALRSSSVGRRRPSQGSSSPEADSVLFPRSRSSTTILLRSASRILPNGVDNTAEIKEEKVVKEETGQEGGNTAITVANESRNYPKGKRQIRADNDVNYAGPRARPRRSMHVGSSELARAGVWQCSLVEFMGSLVLTFVSVAGVIACLRADFNVPRIAVSVTQFLIYTVSILAAGPISGGHLNPSFSFTTMLTGHISLTRAVLYIIAQSAGSVFGALFVKVVISAEIAQLYYLGGCLLKQQVVDSTNTIISVGADSGSAIVAEIFFTFLLISVAFPLILTYSTTTFGDPKLVSGAFITGLLLGLLIFVSGQLLAPGYTSAGMNPARCFGPAVAEGGPALWQPQWVFWLGPFLAGLIFAILYRIIHYRSCNESNLSHDPKTVLLSQDTAETQAKLPLLGPSSAYPRPPQATTVSEIEDLHQPNIITSNLEPLGINIADNAPLSTPPSNTTRRMDVFLHIKATMQKPETTAVDDKENIEGPSSSSSLLLPTDDQHIILEQGNLSLRDLMELPSTSSSAAVVLESDMDHY